MSEYAKVQVFMTFCFVLLTVLLPVLLVLVVHGMTKLKEWATKKAASRAAKEKATEKPVRKERMPYPIYKLSFDEKWFHHI